MLPAQKRQLEMYMQKMQSLRKNSLVFFIAAGVITLATLTFHSYPLIQKIQEHKTEIRKSQAELQVAETDLAKLERELQDRAAEYEVVFKELKPVLEKVFPVDNPKDDVAKFLEDFALSAHTTAHPMKIESVAFSPSKQEKDHMILPFRLSVETDKFNFDRMMQVVEHSGSLKKEDFYKQTQPVPMLSIESISISLPPEKDVDPALQRLSGTAAATAAQSQSFIFNVEMYAYYRAPENAPAKTNETTTTKK